MKDELITFETAKLAKEKGFVWKTPSMKEGGFYKTYEQALETGLVEGLKLIKI